MVTKRWDNWWRVKSSASNCSDICGWIIHALKTIPQKLQDSGASHFQKSTQPCPPRLALSAHAYILAGALSESRDIGHKCVSKWAVSVIYWYWKTILNRIMFRISWRRYDITRIYLPDITACACLLSTLPYISYIIRPISILSSNCIAFNVTYFR